MFATLRFNKKEKVITFPDDILVKYLSESHMKAFNTGTTGIFSITVYAEKEGIKSEKKAIANSSSSTQSNCDPASGCC